MAESPLPPGVTQAEWERLPPRAQLLISAGMVDVDEVMGEWRAHWKDKKESYWDELEMERRLGN